MGHGDSEMRGTTSPTLFLLIERIPRPFPTTGEALWRFMETPHKCAFGRASNRFK